MAAPDTGELYLANIIKTFKYYKTLADRAMAQVPDPHLHTLVDAEANSIAVVVKHLAGNLRSRFTDFLTTDGEKPDRNRDGEFEMPKAVSREQLLDGWEKGWAIAIRAIEDLEPGDLSRTTYVRGEPALVIETLNRLVAHAAYHVGQIVYLSKHFAGERWTTLTIPKRRTTDTPTVH